MQLPPPSHFPFPPTASLDYDEPIPDGFYDLLGDFPEVAEPGEFPSLSAVRHVNPFEGDTREVRA